MNSGIYLGILRVGCQYFRHHRTGKAGKNRRWAYSAQLGVRKCHLNTQDPRLTMQYPIEYAEGVIEDLARLLVRERKQILDRIDQQLQYEPTKKTKNRKPLPGLVPPWEYIDPVWELRVGNYRVFYDVDEMAALVMVRTVRHKPPHKTTGEIL